MFFISQEISICSLILRVTKGRMKRRLGSYDVQLYEGQYSKSIFEMLLFVVVTGVVGSVNVKSNSIFCKSLWFYSVV